MTCHDCRGQQGEQYIDATHIDPPPGSGSFAFRISRTRGFSRQFIHLDLKAHFLNFGVADAADTQSTINDMNVTL
jgi:hypothetical protein